MTEDATPYGAWPSPVSPETVSGGGVQFGHVAVEDGTAWWLERRPAEGGRGVVVRAVPDGARTDVTPADVDVRTLVCEYGGGDFAVRDGTVWFARFEDQRLYRREPGGEPTPVTPEPEESRGLRYADMTLDPGGERIYCVRERHEGPGTAEEPATELAALPADGGEAPTVVAEGHDFYSSPRPDPAGERLAWTTWDHPRMPWDGTTLHVAEIRGDGGLADARAVVGGPAESVFQPAWSPDGTLHAVSDRTGWWNLYRVADEPEPLCRAEAEFGVPRWAFGLSTYAFLDDGRIAVAVNSDGTQRLGLLDGGDLELPDLPYTALPRTRLRSDGEALYVAAASPTEPTSLVRWEPGEPGDGDGGDSAGGEDAGGVGGDGRASGAADPEVLRRSLDFDVDGAYVSEPEHVTYPTGDGAEAHALYYPPTNPDVEAPDGESPPLVVAVHGGPTSQRFPVLNVAGRSGLSIQFWTTRGFGVVDVNYRGSTGYGRAYREALRGEWGVVDVEDCANAARHLAGAGRVDPDRLAIHGGSAGGFATLAALAFHDVFAAGASYYGVADLAALAETTHKFESRYLDGLVGPLPEARETYEARSPAYHADRIDAPLLLLQGDEDPVVPPAQAEAMTAALAENGVPYASVEFEGEQHGFRRAESVERAVEAELSFYAQVFGFEPADDVEPVELVGADEAGGSEG